MKYAEKQLANIDFEPFYRVDFIYQANDFRPMEIMDIASLKPYWG
jgi:hypothetical protein